VKIRHLILILIALPLVSILLTVVPLVYDSAKLDKNAEQEAVAKRIVGLTEETYGELGHQIMITSGSNMTEKNYSKEDLDAARDRLIAIGKELKKLTMGDAAMTKVVERLEVNCLKHVDHWAELGEVYNPRQKKFYLSEFLSKAELMESMKMMYDQINDDLATLNSKYGKAALEFQPNELRNRAEFRNRIGVSVFVIILLVLGSYVVINRTALARLQILMNNIQKFSKGEKSLDTLPGRDELAELDRAFREMSDERNRLEDIRQAMRAMVNHDLRSPLTAINIRLDLMIRKYGETLDPAILVMIKQMYTESQRLVRLASTLLDVEKLEDGLLELRLKQMTTVELIQQSVDSVETLAARKSITLVENADEDAILHCDEDRSIQVLVNLLSNAIKFSPDGSSVEIKSERQDNGFIKVSVLDQGSGVPPEKGANLFSKFQQFDQPDDVKKEGSGLGLYICKMLVETQGGKLGYTPREGGGSCFWFQLPDADAQLEV
jgi:signal transduction histidine kinase